MKTKNFFLILTAVLTISCSTACASDDFMDYLFEKQTVHTIPFKDDNFGHVDIFKDSIAVANSTDSTLTDINSKSRSSNLHSVTITMEGPHNGSYLCTIGYKHIGLKYRSMPGGTFPPQLTHDEDGNELVWIDFNHSGLGSLINQTTEYHYVGKFATAVTVRAYVHYTIDYGIAHKTYTDILEANINGSSKASVTYTQK